VSAVVSYETIHLSAPKDRVVRAIDDRVSGVRRSVVDGVIEYRTNAGVKLATLSDGPSESDSETVLRYRTAYVRPHLFHARRKALAIRDAVAKWRVSPPSRSS